MTRQPQRAWVPFEPLRVYCEHRGGPYAALGSGKKSPEMRAYYRAKLAGRLTVATADHLAVEVFGRHPSEIWGGEFFR